MEQTKHFAVVIAPPQMQIPDFKKVQNASIESIPQRTIRNETAGTTKNLETYETFIENLNRK
jgi:hypothetical protein